MLSIKTWVIYRVRFGFIERNAGLGDTLPVIPAFFLQCKPFEVHSSTHCEPEVHQQALLQTVFEKHVPIFKLDFYKIGKVSFQNPFGSRLLAQLNTVPLVNSLDIKVSLLG